RLPVFVYGALAVLVLYANGTSYYVCFAVFLQFGVGLTPLHAGLMFTPIGVVFAAASILAPRLVGRYRERVIRISPLGYMIGIAGVWLGLALSDTAPNLWILMPVMVLISAMQGFIITPLLNVVIGVLPESHAGMAGGAIATMQQVGNSLGVAAIGLVLFAAASGGAISALHPVEAVAGFTQSM